MALHHAASGELVDIQPLGDTLRESISTTLVRTEHLEVFRLVMPAGSRVPEHKEPRHFQFAGECTVQGLEGAVELKIGDRIHLLRAGSLVYVALGETCALRAVEDAAVLITMLHPRNGAAGELSTGAAGAAGLASAAPGPRR